jgi:hypothetical protein
MELEIEKGRVVVWPKTSGAGTESNFEKSRNDFMLKEGSLPARCKRGGCPGRHRSNHRVLAVDSSCPTATSLLSLSPKYFPSHEPDVVNIDYVVLLELAHSICARACQCRHSYYIFTNK